MRQPYPNELWHYGILGQKWGVRRYQNSDGTLTDAGKKRYVKTIRDQYNAPYGYMKEPKDIVGVSKIKGIRKNTDELRNNLKSVNSEIETELKDYMKEQEKWASIAGAAAGMSYYNEHGYKMDMETLAQNIWFYANEDGDQGYMNSVSVWSKENGKDDKLVSLERDYDRAHREYYDALKSSVNDMLGEYGDTKIKGHTTASYALTSSLLNSGTNGMYANYYISDISNKPYTKNERESVDKAKRIVALLNISSKGNKTWNIVEAVENVGLSDTNFEDMSDSDWAKLSKELSALGGI